MKIAGNSRRMGKNKLALTMENTSLGSIALQTALMSSLDAIYVIVKETDDLIWIPSKIKLNKKCIIVKCNTADQPFITSKLIETIIARIKKNPTSKLVASSYKQIIIPPVLFPKSMYESLLNLHGDMGAKKLLYNSLLNDGELIPNTDKRL